MYAVVSADMERVTGATHPEDCTIVAPRCLPPEGTTAMLREQATLGLEADAMIAVRGPFLSNIQFSAANLARAARALTPHVERLDDPAAQLPLHSADKVCWCFAIACRVATDTADRTVG